MTLLNFKKQLMCRYLSIPAVCACAGCQHNYMKLIVNQLNVDRSQVIQDDYESEPALQFSRNRLTVTVSVTFVILQAEHNFWRHPSFDR